MGYYNDVIQIFHNFLAVGNNSGVKLTCVVSSIKLLIYRNCAKIYWSKEKTTCHSQSNRILVKSGLSWLKLFCWKGSTIPQKQRRLLTCANYQNPIVSLKMCNGRWKFCVVFVKIFVLLISKTGCAFRLILHLQW